MLTNDKQGRMTLDRILITLGAIVIVIAGLRQGAELLVPFLLALFIAIILTKPVNFLKNKGVGLPLTLLIIVFVMLVIGGLLLVLVGTSISDFIQEIPSYQAKLHGKRDALVNLLKRMGVEGADERLFEVVDPGAIMGLFGDLLKGVQNILTKSFLIMLITVFILLEMSSFSRKLRSVVEKPTAVEDNFKSFVENIQRYMILKTYISLATGGLIFLWLLAVGMDNPVLWGLVSFLLNFIPSIGSIIAAIPAVLIAIVKFGPLKAGLVAVGYLAVNITFGNMLEPRIMGQGVGLSTLVVFLSLVFWGWVFGPIGMLLSVPLTMSIKFAMESRDDTKWIGLLMGPADAGGEKG